MGDVDTLAPPRDTMHVDLRGKDAQNLSEMRMQGSTEQRARVLTAKLSLPHQGFVLSRPRLHTLIEPVLGGGAVYLAAGPGYGKTAFIVDLLSSATGRAVYYSVDEGDRDPVRFLSLLMAGLGMEAPGHEPAPSLGWAAISGGEEPALELVAQLQDYISSCAGQPTLMAIDDLHLIDSSSQAISALELITRGLPPDWTIILSSRRRLPFALDGVSLGGRLVQLQGRELRLTPHEVTAWARQFWSVQLQPSEARALWRLTEGWPAALVLLGQHLLARGTEVSGEDIARIIGRGRDLRKYLERHILSGLDSFAAETMLTASLLPRVIFPRDEVFLPGLPGQAESVLEELVSRGFLVTRAGRRVYTIHPLMRGFAECQAIGAEEETGLIGRAAAHLEHVGEYYHAASLLLRAGHLSAAATPIRSLALSSLNASVSFARDDWLDLIPEMEGTESADNPWLLTAKARIFQQQADYNSAGILYERSARLLSSVGDKEGLVPVLLSLAFCLYNRGCWDQSLAVLGRCRALARSAREKVEVLVAEGNVLVSLCRWEEAVEDWERALVLAPLADRAALTRRIYFHRARLFYSMGHYRLAGQWMEKSIGQTGKLQTPGDAMALNGAAILAYLTGEYGIAGRQTDECLRLARSRGYSFVEISSLLNQAAVAMGAWDYRSAIVKLREAERLAAKSGDAEASFWAEDMLGDLCRRNKNVQRALEHHQVAREIVAESRLAVFEEARALAGVGMDLAVLGQEVDARAALEEALQISRRWGLMSSLSPVLLYLGWLSAREGREREAARCLSEAIRIAADHGHVHFFSQEARVAAPILALCDRFEAGSFVRENILPRLPARLQAYFHQLASGKRYPTDVALGPPQRALIAQTPVLAHRQAELLPSEVVESVESLTERECEILKMIALGMSNKLIASKLYITEKTVKTHANHVYRKLGVASRVQATLVFQRYQRAHKVGRTVAGQRI